MERQNPGPAGRPPRNHVFRLQEFMKFQVHPSVPRPRSASALNNVAADKPAYYCTFHHQRITPCHPYYPYPPILKDFACKQALTHVRIAEHSGVGGMLLWARTRNELGDMHLYQPDLNDPGRSKGVARSERRNKPLSRR